MARLRRPLGVLVIVALAGVLLAGCGSGGALSDARISCVLVHRALTDQRESQARNLSVARQHFLQSRALSELLKATPAAAAATSLDGSWNPLMTTINEAERVPLVDLVASLSRLCRVADSSTPYL